MLLFSYLNIIYIHSLGKMKCACKCCPLFFEIFTPPHAPSPPYSYLKPQTCVVSISTNVQGYNLTQFLACLQRDHSVVQVVLASFNQRYLIE
jgi:hypothetical protein